MNNEVTPEIPPAPETPTPSTVKNGGDSWVPKAQYSSGTDIMEKQRTDQLSKNRRIRLFYKMLAISGILLFILYMGMLAWPSEYISKGNCTGTEFLQIAFWLNPVAYALLLTAGIIGTTTKHLKTTVLGTLCIIASPIGWFISGFLIVAPLLCGV